MRKLATFTAAAALVAAFGFAGSAWAGLSVEKTLTGCTYTGGVVDIEAIPVGEVITCTFDVKVTVGGGQTVEDIVVTDKVSTDLDIISSGAFTVLPRKGANNTGATPIEWDVGTQVGLVMISTTIVTETNVDPGGNQRYTEFCEDVELNSGPMATGLEENPDGKLKKVSAEGDPITGTTEGCE